jgi:hypothetical protein
MVKGLGVVADGCSEAAQPQQLEPVRKRHAGIVDGHAELSLIAKEMVDS